MRSSRVAFSAIIVMLLSVGPSRARERARKFWTYVLGFEIAELKST